MTTKPENQQIQQGATAPSRGFKEQITPGPWIDRSFQTEPGQMIHVRAGYLNSRETELIALVRSESDARLIATAPELLEVAQGILADDMLQYLPAEYVSKVRAAIAKATGEGV